MQKPLNSLAARLTVAMKESDCSAASLARACKVSRASVSEWLNGKIGQLKTENLMRAAEVLRVHPEWLRTGEGPMRPRRLSEQESELLTLFRAMDRERQLETLKYAAYARTISNPVTERQRKQPA